MRLREFRVCIFFFLVSCHARQEQTRPTLENITESVYASGIVKSKNQYQVFAAANGLIKEVLVTEGDVVQKGDPIMRIANETAQLNAENARLAANYSSITTNTDKLKELQVNTDLAKTRLTNDSMLLARQRNLWKEGIGARNELEQRELAFNSARSAYTASLLRYHDLKKQIAFTAQQSQKNLQLSRSIANDYTVRSEADGKVYSILKENGEMVNSQSPVAIIGDATAYLLELQVDEYDIARIRPNQKVFVTMDSYKGQVYEGLVVKINPIMNERSRSFTVEAVFTITPPALYPNLTVEANILIQTKEKALTIPRNYLLNDSLVILPGKERRRVTVGLKDYKKAEIIKGLIADDVILKPQ